MKKTFIITIFAIITLASCKEKENTDIEGVMEKTNQQMQETVDDLKESSEKAIAATQVNATQMANDFESNVVVENGKIISVKGYDGFTNLNNAITELNTSTAANRSDKSTSLRTSFENFKSTLPDYLKTRRVNRAIKKMEKELTEYEKEMVGSKSTVKNDMKNISNIQEEFDDVQKFIAKSREKYIDNKKDAMEEYMEEINSGRDQTTTEKYLDATEEYNEEMKDK